MLSSTAEGAGTETGEHQLTECWLETKKRKTAPAASGVCAREEAPTPPAQDFRGHFRAPCPLKNSACTWRLRDKTAPNLPTWDEPRVEQFSCHCSGGFRGDLYTHWHLELH